MRFLCNIPRLVLGMMKIMTRLPLGSSYWQNLSGGTALQVCAKERWTKYCALVFEKLV